MVVDQTAEYNAVEDLCLFSVEMIDLIGVRIMCMEEGVGRWFPPVRMSRISGQHDETLRGSPTPQVQLSTIREVTKPKNAKWTTLRKRRTSKPVNGEKSA